MLKRTHEAFAGAFWAGGTLLINLVSYRVTGDMTINTGIAMVGTICAIPTSAGKNSPDIDHRWWPGFPKRMPEAEYLRRKRKNPGKYIERRYWWKGHRGITHRFWFASLLTTPFLILSWLMYVSGFSLLVPIVMTLPAGWYSHLLGDMIYGKLLICGRVCGLGWETGGASETGKRRNGGKRFVIDPAAKFFSGLTLILIALHAYTFILMGL